MENNENICFNSTSAQSITSEVIKEKTEKNEIISDIIGGVIKEEETEEFMEKQWNELGLTREQARNMTVTEYKKYAEQLHGKPMEVAGVAKPVNGWDVSRCNGFEE